jgi:hypothetical protein
VRRSPTGDGAASSIHAPRGREGESGANKDRKHRYAVDAARGELRARAADLQSWDFSKVGLGSCWRALFVCLPKNP